jgi:hypothetical protein
MARRCTICYHAQVEDINAAVSRDGSRPTARQFQISRAALDRHKKHIPRGRAASTPDVLVERMLGLLRNATGDKDTPTLRELRGCLEQMGKVVKTTPRAREEDLELQIAQKISEATLGFDPDEIARLKALLVERENPLARIM